MRNRNHDNVRKIIFLIIDIAAIIASAIFAYIATSDDLTFKWHIGLWFAVDTAFCVAVFFIMGMYSFVYDSIGIVELLKIVFAMLIILLGNMLYIVVTNWIMKQNYPDFTKDILTPGTAVIFTMMLFVITGLSRFYKRIVLVGRHYATNIGKAKKRVLIVGAGKAGASLITEIQNSANSAYNVVCFADDSPEKFGKYVNGVKVAGTTYDIKKLVKRYNVEEIFVTMPSVPKMRVSKILTRCKDSGKPVKILPSVYQLAEGKISVSDMREVDIQDLLGREQVTVDLNEIMGYIEGKVILVTGGGGSIGSELCRQIATHRPKLLIILDIYENNAYDIEQELKRSHPNLNLLTLIASIRDEGKIKDVFEKYRPAIVFHAAAHKHVPLMETSPNEAVKNNVFGTFNVARFADMYGAETFVQISTDKAVNPTNVMGATKRICEMIVQAFGRHSQTKFVAVRFGNVLGSNGSVIPLFKKQIAEGGPVTVTHRDIIRYFMTIPEAVSLVLQAGAYAKGGQIFVLDMGEPVKIYDLAYNLIKLSGLEPNVDIDIKVTGLRPGEKLYEERLMDEEGLQKTPNGLINIAQPIQFDEQNFWKTMENLYTEAYKETPNIKELVKELVPTYIPENEN